MLLIFYEWARKSSMTNVTVRFVSAKQCEDVEKVIEMIPIASVKGTMKLHAVVGLGNCKIKTRDVNYYFFTCID